MLWSRSRREARRQKVLDELLGLDPAERPARLDTAVAAGDVRADEVDEALRMVHRLDDLRVMTVPPSGRLPGGIVPIIDFPLRDRPAASSDRVAAKPRRKPVAVDLPVASVDAVEAATIRIAADLAAARKARPGARSSRQRRLRIAANQRPAEEPVAVAADGSHEEAWPSIEWLRP